MFTEDHIEFKERELVDLRKYVHEYVMSHASEDFFIIGFNIMINIRNGMQD